MNYKNIKNVVYIEHEVNGILHIDIMCIAVDKDAAELIVKTMNFAEKYIKQHN